MVAMRDERKDRTPELRLAERIKRWRVSAGTVPVLALLIAGVAGFSEKLGALLALAGTETTTQLLFDFGNDPWGSLFFVVGLVGVVIVLLGVLAGAIHASPKHLGAGLGVFAIFMLVGGLIAMGAAPVATSTSTQTSPATQLKGYIVAPSEVGCSVNTITNTETCDGVYNYTSNYFAVSSSNASTCNWYSAACHPRSYIDFAVHEARVDSINATEGAVFAIGSIPTVTTTGATPTVYSPVAGYVPATSSATGYWLVKQNAGSLNGLNPSEAAPATTSNLGASTVGITAFGSTTDTWNVTLPGSGSSAAPAALYTALTLYGSYSMTFTVTAGQSSFVYTLTLIDIGEHA